MPTQCRHLVGDFCLFGEFDLEDYKQTLGGSGVRIVEFEIDPRRSRCPKLQRFDFGVAGPPSPHTQVINCAVLCRRVKLFDHKNAELEQNSNGIDSNPVQSATLMIQNFCFLSQSVSKRSGHN